MKKLLIPMIAFLFVLISCENRQSQQKEDTANKKLEVFAVNYPLFYFAERIGGEHIELLNVIPANVDPAYWVPMQSLEEIQNTDLILANGANYAKWMERVSLPSSKIVNTTAAFSDKYIKIEEGTTHSHGAGGDHVHYGYAFTTWLDFEIAIGQAEAIKNALTAKRPQHKEIFNTNFIALKAELKQLDDMMLSVAEKFKDQNLFVSHPVYQYLGKAYDLQIISEHWEPGEMPTENQWSAFKHNLDLHPANLMLWEGEPSDELKVRLKDAKVTTVLFNPCSNQPVKGDFLSTMKQNISNLIM